MNLEFNYNGRKVCLEVEPRWLVSDVLRERLSDGTVRTGCEQGVCGTCTIMVDGELARSCLTIAGQLHGHEVLTWEGCRDSVAGQLLERSMSEKFGLQCGYCTTGILISAYANLSRAVSEELAVDEFASAVLDGHLCRCTGYTQIVEALTAAAEESKGA